MRILQVAPPWFSVPPERYGGTELVVGSLADGLTARGHDVTLVASGGSVTSARLHSPYRVPPSASLGDPVVELPHVLAAHRWRDGVDLVHDHTTLGAALASVGSGAPVVHTLHHEWSLPMARVLRQVADRVHVVAISHDHAARAPADVPLAGVVHNGIELERFPFTPHAAVDGHLAFLGRSGADKGADVAVEVAARTGLPLRMAVKVNEADEREWWTRVMEPLLARRTARVEVIDNADHEEKVELLAGARALLCPLRWDEPFGLMMAEAGACGTPVVAWRRGASSEVVEHGRTGLLVDPGDVDGLCDAVRRVGELDRRAARDRIARLFSAERMVRDYERLYRRVVDGHRAWESVVTGDVPALAAGALAQLEDGGARRALVSG